MNKLAILASVLCCALATPVFADDDDTTQTEKLVKHLQEVSVTVKAESRWSKGEGSGVIVTRTLKDKAGKEHKVNFVWTAGHVIDNLRKVREAIDPKTGTTKKIIEFGRPQIVQELRDSSGQRIGEVKLDTVVLCYSDADTGEDLALLMVLKKNFVKSSAKFYLGKKTLGMGTRICHVGSRHGQFGANSFSSGRISAVGRVLKSVSNKEFDQTSVPASPGSSGGGIYVESGAIKKDGKRIDLAGQCLGLIVRGGESTFNFIVPVRRMLKWSKKMNVSFALDPSVKAPTIEDLSKITIEDGWINRNSSRYDKGARKGGRKVYKSDERVNTLPKKAPKKATPGKLIRKAKKEITETPKKLVIKTRKEAPKPRIREKEETPLDELDPVDQVKYFKAMADR